ncbi:MAG: class I tRNA ligase family protein, partial [bacterium]
TDILKLLHPFMPFITEEIYGALPHTGEALIIERYPEFREELCFAAEEAGFERIMDAISAIRSRRSEMNVPPSKKAKVLIATPYAADFRSGEAYLERLASASEVIVSEGEELPTEGMVTVITHSAKIAIPMAELVDLAKERERVTKELKKNRGFLEAQEKKLSNASFTSRAPAAVVAAEREKAEKLQALIKNLEATLASLN